MPRPAQFTEAQIIDATAAIAAAEGPAAATIGAIGAALRAPTGSIYYRFPSRDGLLGRLWLTKAGFFQDRFVTALAASDPANAGLRAALSLPRSVHEDFAGARIMLLHRREDFLSDHWSSDMRAEAVRLKRQVDDALRGITRRLFGRTTPRLLRLATCAILDVPFAIVRRHVAANELPPADAENLIATAYWALIRPSRKGGEHDLRDTDRATDTDQRGSRATTVRRRGTSEPGRRRRSL